MKPFLPFKRKRIEEFYESCGNALIYYGDFTHVMMDNPKQQLAAIAFKNEEVHMKEYESFEEAHTNIKKFIEEVYNKKRLHSSIGYMPPEEFEKKAEKISLS